MLLAFLTIIGSEMNATAIQTSLPNLIQMVLSVTFHYRISPKWRRQTPVVATYLSARICEVQGVSYYFTLAS